MSTVDRIGSNTFVVFSAKCISLILGLFFNVLFARTLGEEAFGIFSYGIAFVYFFSLVMDFGLNPILVRELSKSQSKRGLIFANAIILKGALILFSYGLIYLAVTVLDFSSETKSVIFILAFVFLFSAKSAGLRGLLEAPYQAELRMVLPSCLQILDTSLAVGLLLLALNLKAGVVWTTLTYVAASIPGFLIMLKRTIAYGELNWRFDANQLQTMAKEALPLAVYTGGIAIFTNLDILLIKHLLTDAELGWYAAAHRLVTPLSFLPFAIVASLFPLMSKYSVQDSEKLKRIFHSGSKFMLLAGTTITLVGLIWGDEIITILFGKGFQKSIVPYKILVTTTCFLFLNFFMVDFNTANGRQKLNQFVVIALVLSNLLLNLMLIPQLGIQGASIARLISFVIGTLFFFSITANFMRMSQMMKIIKLALIGIAGVALILFLDHRPTIMSLTVIPGYLIAVILLKVFDRNELNFVQNQFQRLLFN